LQEIGTPLRKIEKIFEKVIIREEPDWVKGRSVYNRELPKVNHLK